jgi:hypothetical protein
MVFLLMESLVLERIHPIPIKRNYYERHWAPADVIIKITTFWNMKACNLVDM